MRTGVWSLTFVVIIWFAAAVPVASAATIGFVNNPSTNSSDWAASVGLNGVTITTGVDFNTHPIYPAALDPTFYLPGFGVTLTTSDAPFVSSGGSTSGPDATPPLSTGEGPHDGSRKLWFNGVPGQLSTLIIDFDAPVLGMGFFLIDLWNPNVTGTTVTLEVFAGAGATGTLLTSLTAPSFNFQYGYQTFMGVVSTDHDIRSARFTTDPASIGDSVAIDDIRFARSVPLPAAAWLGLTLLGALGTMRRLTSPKP